jgi:hypothetical protein
VCKHAHQSIKDAVHTHLVSLKGAANHHIAPDLVTEKINLEGRYISQHSTNQALLITFKDWEFIKQHRL